MFTKNAAVHKARSLFRGLFALVILSAPAFAGPQIHLPEGGAYIWSNSITRLDGLFALNNGAEVMVVFSTSRVSDGAQHLYYQVVDENLQPQFDEPAQLSSENSNPRPGNACSDAVGCVFVAWLEDDPDNAGQVRLLAVKFSPEGEPVWNDFPQVVGSLRSASADDYLPNLLPDDHGGFYFCNGQRFVAVDEEGNFREGWPWRDVRPDPQLPMQRSHGDYNHWEVRADHEGGLWYELSDGGYPNYVFNHLDYEGNRYLDEPRGFIGRGLEEEVRGYLLMCLTFPGGAMINTLDMFFPVDRLGVCLGERFVYQDNRIVGNATMGAMLLRRRGDLIMAFDNDPRHEGGQRGLIAYNPLNNTFPWGREGANVAPSNIVDERPVDREIRVITELPNGDIVCCKPEDDRKEYTSFFRLSAAGQRRWQEPSQVDWFEVLWMVPSNQDGFWALGNSSLWRGGRDGELCLLQRFDINGHPAGENFIDYGVKDRLLPRLGDFWDLNIGSHRALFWRRDNGDYRWFSHQRWIGFKAVDMDAEGNIVGDPMGNLVLENRTGLTPVFSRRVGERLVFLEEDGSRVMDPNRYRLWAMNLDGDLLWTTDLDERGWLPNLRDKLPLSSPDGANMFMGMKNDDLSGAHTECALVIKFNLETGEQEWSASTPIIRQPLIYVYPLFAVSEEAVYAVAGWSSDTLQIMATDYAGNQIGAEIFHFYRNYQTTELFGAAGAADGNLWVGFASHDNGETDCWLQKYDRNEGRFTQSIYPWAEPWRGEVDWDEGPPFELIPSGDNLWIIPFDTVGRGIQCLTQDGERRLGNYGFLPESVRSERVVGDFRALPEEGGGLWLTFIATDRSVRALHFDSTGLISIDWERNGEIVFSAEQRSSIYDAQILDRNNLIITAVTTFPNPANPFNTAYGNFMIQHVSEVPSHGASGQPAEPPVEFALRSLYPQPFNSRLQVVYQAPQNAEVTLRVYDLTGRLVEGQTWSTPQAGEHRLSLDASEWRSGVYFLTMESGSNRFTRKVVLLR